MKLFLIAAFVAVASAAKLSNNYLPPNSAKTAGGSGNFLSTPFGSSASRNSFGAFGGSSFKSSSSSSNFGSASTRHGGAPNQQYGAPSGASGRFSGSKSAEAGAAIVRFNNNNNGDGSYQFEFETQNKISQNEAGQLKNAGSDNEAEEVHGSYSYTSPEGQVITVNYIANEFGFQPVGDHLPTPPPIPEAILKSLQQISASGSSNNGFSSGNNGQYKGNNLNNQYLAPKTSSFNSQAGYRY